MNITPAEAVKYAPYAASAIMFGMSLYARKQLRAMDRDMAKLQSQKGYYAPAGPVHAEFIQPV